MSAVHRFRDISVWRDDKPVFRHHVRLSDVFGLGLIYTYARSQHLWIDGPQSISWQAAEKAQSFVPSTWRSRNVFCELISTQIDWPAITAFASPLIMCTHIGKKTPSSMSMTLVFLVFVKYKYVDVLNVYLKGRCTIVSIMDRSATANHDHL